MSEYGPDRQLAIKVAHLMRDHGETMDEVAAYIRRTCYDAFLAADASDTEALLQAKRRSDATYDLVAVLHNIAAAARLPQPALSL